MRSAMNPIQARMRMRMPNPQGMPAIIPGPDQGEEMPPGQGDMGMETMFPDGMNSRMPSLSPDGDYMQEDQEPYPVNGHPPMGDARAMPVHSMGEVQHFYNGMGKTPPAPVSSMTGTMQQTPEGPLRSKLHAAQHQMMAGDQKSAISMKRMELSSKKQQLESVLQQIRRGETLDADGRMFKKIAAGIGQIDSLLSQFPMDTAPAAVPGR